jgi:2,4-dienoyl-CoA reductase-like NADH-dependent reductase (Old Yellow Enzyme family)
MTKMHERFKYRTKDDLQRKTKDLGFDLPYTDDITPLFQPYQLAGFSIANRLVVQPMEGYDSENEGSPSELSTRRYMRYASGGSGIIWHEAVSVMQDGRSNPRQLWIHKKNTDNYSRLNDEVRKNAMKHGIDPFLVVQLTHSGRYSKPEGIAKPKVAALNPILDKITPVILTDDDLKRIMDQFVEASKLAYKSGFNGIDIKACHGYLVVDLLSARTRMNSIFGGDETSGRFRFLLETIDRIMYEVPEIIVTTRLGISDLYPGGFGVDEKGEMDLTEPFLLVDQLKLRGIGIINITMGSPYHNPHVSRPYDNPLPGQAKPGEHPLEGVMRMINSTSLFQERFPEIAMVGSAWSFLRHFAPNVGASVIRNGQAAFMGFGRNSFAYPSMPLDMMKNGMADPRKACITCSGCTRLIRSLKPGGCVIHDREIYGNELKKLIADEK